MGLNIIDDYENLIEIGCNVALSPNVTFVASSNPNYSKLGLNPRFVKKAKIFIGDNSWIGTGAVIMPGILIGKDCIIGSNAVVTKDVNDFEIVAGIPAKVIGKTN
ncbi:MAG: acyltransferase [Bacteroidota bacterium]|jgi:acetyltransferase-like isoleucine patch superfamily enzyme